MRSYLDHILSSFHSATGWNADNSYANLTATSRDVLDFALPRGFSVTVCSMASGASATSYTLRNLSGIVDGSVAYFYSQPRDLLAGSRLRTASKRGLADAMGGVPSWWLPQDQQADRQRQAAQARVLLQEWQAGRRVDPRSLVVYAKMYVPARMLEALVVSQLGPHTQATVMAVSSDQIRHGGSATAQVARQRARWTTEAVYATDEALTGVRALYSAGGLSAGAEMFYGALNKAGGVSTGLRYVTTTALEHPHQHQHNHLSTTSAFTLTCNPVTAHVSAAYAVRAAATGTAFASRLEFNGYSYESDLTVGCELWRSTSTAPGDNTDHDHDDVETILRLRASTSQPAVRIMVEGRLNKAFVCSLGADVRVTGLQSLGAAMTYAG
ncbi:hypothetical protein V1514DRAFT_320568 [Lipomyces japonicus]|uniref:uncharacterized protein n=1 Tax=Lipomyces japonicus TaxID=56871 RepID=UPI0034CF3B66